MKAVGTAWRDSGPLLALFRLNKFSFFFVLCVAFPAALDAAEPIPQKGRVELTAPERQWLAEHPVIRVAPDPDYPPIESLDGNGRIVGMSADYLKLLEKKLGIRFEILPVSSWDQAMGMARSREVDMLSAATKSSARSEYMSFTTPHIELPGVIIVHSNAGDFSGLDQLRGKRVGVVSSYIWQEWINRDYPGIDLQPVRDMQTGLAGC
jgi:ABC-type amino acid transport substrate-binding protein